MNNGDGIDVAERPKEKEKWKTDLYSSTYLWRTTYINKL